MGSLLSIVINNSNMKIAELSSGRKGVTVSRLLTKEVPESLMEDGVIRDVRAFAEFLSSALLYANIKTKRVIFSLPSDKIMTREVILPEMNEEKLKTALKVNASDYFPIDLSDYVLSYFPISKIVEDNDSEEETPEETLGNEKGKKKKSRKKKSGKQKAKLRLMAIAAPNEMVQSYYDAAKLAHLKLDAVDYVGNSVFQLTSGQVGDEPCLVIQLDEEHTVLTIFNDNVMVLQRHVDFGSAAVVQAVMDAKRLGYEEAESLLENERLILGNFDSGDEVTESFYYLISNIRRTIEYYTGRNVGQPLDQIYVMGDGSSFEGLALLFESQLDLPVETITALKQVIIKESTGLSMKEILKYMDNIGAAIAPVDLIPKQLEQDIRRKLEAKAYRVMILLSLLIALLIVTFPTIEYFNIAMDTMELQNKLLTVEDVKPILERYQEAELQYADVQQVQALGRTNNESLLNFIRIFEQLRPSNISIQSFSCSDGQITFSALAQGKKTVAKLIQQLNTIANVSEVKVSALSSVFEGDQETVSFSLTCVLVNEDAILAPGSTAKAMENLMPEGYEEVIGDPEESGDAGNGETKEGEENAPDNGDGENEGTEDGGTAE